MIIIYWHKPAAAAASELHRDEFYSADKIPCSCAKLDCTPRDGQAADEGLIYSARAF